jgi:hypothetical protein
MARRYINPNRPAAGLVTDDLLEAAHERVADTAARLQAAEAANPSAPGWDSEYVAARAAARAAELRLSALESLRARQVEGAGRRAAAVKAAARDMQSIATGLSASRDQVAVAASAADAHNKLLAASRAQVAALGLAVRDDLLGDGTEHPEGTLDSGGLRVGGTNWTPVPAAGLVASALTTVFGVFRGPFAGLRWPAHQTTTRPDGLRVPSLADAGVTLPLGPMPVVLPQRASVGDLGPPSMTQTELDEQNRTGFLSRRRSA